jgi:uncharacterized protein
VFIDTSILFAAIGSPRGYARDLLMAGINGQCQVFLSEYVIAEAERSIGLKRPAAIPILREFVALLPRRAEPDATLVADVGQRLGLGDENDVPIVAGAVQARAEYLATYDRKHLLSVGDQINSQFGIVVATPQDLLAPSTER